LTVLGFIDGAYNRAQGTRAAFGAVSAQLVREGYPRMVSRSGDREPADEVAVFLSRYRALTTGGGPFGDVRWWGGVRYVRFSSAGTVAPPGSSNHGKRRSNDLAYPYNSDTVAARRAKEIAKKHNITREGENFGELWHWTFWGVLGTIDSPSAAGEETGWDTMASKQDIKDALFEVLTQTRLGPGQRNHYDSLSFIADGVFAGTAEKVWAHGVAAQDTTGHVVRDEHGNPVVFQAQGFIASIAAQLGGTVANVDEAALAQALAPLIVGQLGSLSDEDVQRIAAASSDEQARRLTDQAR